MRRFWGLAAFLLGISGLVSWIAIRAHSSAGETRGKELAAALEKRRPLEARLARGGHARCERLDEPERLLPRMRCSPPADPAEVRALRKIPRAEIRRGESEDDRHAEGLALLLAYGRDEKVLKQVVESFEETASRRPADARAFSDLAAARLALAEERDDPAGLVLALADVREALRLAPKLPEARFNHALILERLYLVDQATAAWDSYIKQVDGNSSWAEEARIHWLNLQRPLAPELWNQKKPELRVTALRGDDANLRKIVSFSPQDVREEVMDRLLPVWGTLLLEGKKQEAMESLSVARALGEALLAETGEASASRAVRAIDRAISRGGESDLLALAKGHVAYQEGYAALNQQQTDKPAALLAEAWENLRRGGSPAEEWARLGLAGVNLRSARYEEAIERYEDLVRDGEAGGSWALQGKAHSGIGVSHIRQGHYSPALTHYRLAAAAFGNARENFNVGVAQELIAENLRLLGQRGAAWRYRFQAAKALHPYRSSVRLHNVLWEGAWAAIEDGRPTAGLAFSDEDVEVTKRSEMPQLIAESLLWRSKVHLALHAPGKALDDLESAQSINATVVEERLQKRLGADLAYVEGEIRRQIDPASAPPVYEQAINFYTEGKLYLDLAGALSGRAQAALAAGRIDEAEAGFSEAIDLFESQRDLLTDIGSKVTYSEVAQGLYDSMILLQAEARQDREAALGYSERARALALGSLTPAPPQRLPDLTRQIPGNLAVIEYARVQNRLLTWVLWQGRIESHIQDVPDERFETRIRRFIKAIERGENPESIDRLAKELYSILIPSTVAALPANVELCLIPDKILNTLPFAALRNPRTRRFLIEERTISIIPGLARSGAGKKQRLEKPSAFLVAATVFDRNAFPDLLPLPGAEEEIRGVAPLYESRTVLQGKDATRDRLLAELDRHEIFHLAGHSTFNEQHPEHSYFVVAPSSGGGVIFLREITGRRFGNLRLVLLSSCRSLGAKDTRILGISGLARPFLDAGVEEVVGSLWNVGDEAASQLIPEFHRRYLASGDAAEALRGAQIAMLRSGDEKLRSPQAWAVFQAVGKAW